MRPQTNALRSFLRSLALTDVVIFLLAAGIWWLLGGRSLAEYGSALVWAGGAAIAVGLLSLFGGWGATRSFTYQQAASAYARSPGRLAPWLGGRYGCRGTGQKAALARTR